MCLLMKCRSPEGIAIVIDLYAELLLARPRHLVNLVLYIRLQVVCEFRNDLDIYLIVIGWIYIKSVDLAEGQYSFGII
jgi:hypothetical protein